MSNPLPASIQAQLPLLVSGRVICEKYGWCARTLYRYRKDGLIPHLRFNKRCYRYSLPEIEKALAKLRG